MPAAQFPDKLAVVRRKARNGTHGMIVIRDADDQPPSRELANDAMILGILRFTPAVSDCLNSST